MTRDEARSFIKGLSEDMAHAVLHALMEKFSWSGTMFCPDDLREYVIECRQADGQDPLDPDALEEWVNDLILSHEWNRGLTDRLTEEGWELIGMAYSDLKYDREGGAE